MGLVCASCSTYLFCEIFLKIKYCFHFIDEGNSCSKRKYNLPNFTHLSYGKTRIEIYQSCFKAHTFGTIKKLPLSTFIHLIPSFVTCLCAYVLYYIIVFKKIETMSLIIPFFPSAPLFLAVSYMQLTSSDSAKKTKLLLYALR